MKNVFLLVGNTLKITFRKKGNIVLYLLLPLIGIIASQGLYSGAKSEPMKIAVLDQDQSVLSQYLVDQIETSGNYIIAQLEPDEIKKKLLDQSIGAEVIIPTGYGKRILTVSSLKIEIVSLQGQATTAWLEQFYNLQTRNLSDLALAAEGNPTAFSKLFQEYVKNPLPVDTVAVKDESISKYITMESLGFLLLFVMLGTGFTSQLILNEKKSRTYYRICSSPVNAREYLGANTLSSMIIVAVQSLLIILALPLLFHIETFVPGYILFIVLFLFGLVSIGIALVTAAFSSSSYMAGTLSTLIVTPTCLIGGCFWPVYLMPDMMQKIAHFMPQWWAIDAIQHIQSGGRLTGILINIAILLAFTAAFFLLAIFRFSREENVQKFI